MPWAACSATPEAYTQVAIGDTVFSRPLLRPKTETSVKVRVKIILGQLLPTGMRCRCERPPVSVGFGYQFAVTISHVMNMGCVLAVRTSAKPVELEAAS